MLHLVQSDTLWPLKGFDVAAGPALWRLRNEM